MDDNGLLLGIDIGYGRTKFYRPEARGDFASLVSSQITPQVLKTTVNPLVISGRAYLAGEEAELHCRSTEDTRCGGFLCSGAWYALLGHALLLAGFDPRRRGSVITIGLPPGHFSEGRYGRVLQSMKDTSITYQSQGVTYTFDRTRIFVIPQGVGIYYYYYSIDETAEKRNVAVVDIGYQTLDMVFLAKGDYIEHVSRTAPLGVSTELDNLVRLAQGMTERRGPIRRGDILASLADGSVFRECHPSFIPGAAEQIQAYAKNVLTTVDSFLESLPKTADSVIVGGGGADLLVAAEVDLPWEVLDQAVLANAIGYYVYACITE
jgi:hypothetical protein